MTIFSFYSPMVAIFETCMYLHIFYFVVGLQQELDQLCFSMGLALQPLVRYFNPKALNIFM